MQTHSEKNGLIKTVFEFLRFVEYLRIMSSSPDKLVTFLSEDKFSYLHRHFRDCSDDQKRLLHRKGFYLYTYFDDRGKFMEIFLPPLNCWKNSQQQG